MTEHMKAAPGWHGEGGDMHTICDNVYNDMCVDGGGCEIEARCRFSADCNAYYNAAPVPSTMPNITQADCPSASIPTEGGPSSGLKDLWGGEIPEAEDLGLENFLQGKKKGKRKNLLRGDGDGLPEKDGDKAFKSSADACQACYFFAHQSVSMKEYCTCYSANTAAFGATSGGFKMETTDQDNWRWTCSPTPVIGDNYAPCTQASGRLYEDQYGDATKL